MAITFEEALALPTAEYIHANSAGLSSNSIIRADMQGGVITNRTSLLPIPHTDALNTCVAVAVENVTAKKHAIALVHASMYPKEALEKMIPLVRRSPRDRLEVHLVGGFYDIEGSNDPAKDKQIWEEDMRGVIGVINANPNVELKTFDVGHKPHPTSVAFAPGPDGKTRLVRGSPLYTSDEQERHHSRAEVMEFRSSFKDIEKPPMPHSFRESRDNPFHLLFDGRTPDNQDWGKNPKAEKAAAGKAARKMEKW